MKTLYNRKYGGGNGDRRSFAFFVAGGLAVLAAVFLIGLQVGRYVEKNSASRADDAGRSSGRDNAAEIRKDLGAFSEDAARVKPVPPPPVDTGAREAEKSVTFPETLARKDPEVVPLVQPAPKAKAAARPGKDAAPAGKPFLVQTAVFRNKTAARDMKARLAKAGYPVQVIESRGVKGAFYRVLVGPYASRDAAMKTMRKLKAEMKIDAALARG